MKTSSSNLLKDFPIKQQLYKYDCGACCMWSILKYIGIEISYREFLNLLKPLSDGLEGEEIEEFLKKMGIKIISEKSTIEKLRACTEKGWPSIVSIQHKREKNKTWEETIKYGHYVVVLKITNTNVYFMNPEYGKIQYLEIEKFKERWHDGDETSFYQYPTITCML